MRYLTLLSLLLFCVPVEVKPLEISPSSILSDCQMEAKVPQVAVNEEGIGMALWLSSQGKTQVLSVATSDASGVWSAPQPIRQCTFTIIAPQLVLNETGSSTVLWIERSGTDSHLKVRQRSIRGTWTEDQTLATAKGISSASLAMNALGQLVAIWQETSEGIDQINVAKSLASQQWSATQTLTKESEYGHAPAIALNAQGDCVALFEQEGRIMHTATDENGSWTAPSPLSEHNTQAMRPQIMMNPSGQALAIWETGTGFKVSLQGATRSLEGTWSRRTALSNEEETISEPKGAINESGDAVVVWRGSTAKGFCVRMIPASAQGEWGEPITLSQGKNNALNPLVAMNTKSEGVIVWRETKAGKSTLHGITLSKDSQWSAPTSLMPDASRIAQHSLALSATGKALLLWRARTDSISTIHAETITLNDPAPPSLEKSSQEQETDFIENPSLPTDPKDDFGSSPPPLSDETVPSIHDNARHYTSPRDSHLQDPSPQEKPEKENPAPEDTAPEEAEQGESTLHKPTQEPPFDEHVVSPNGKKQKTTSPEEASPKIAPGSAEEKLTVVLEEKKLETSCCLMECCWRSDWYVELKGGVYRPSNKRYRSIFGQAFAYVGLQAEYSFWDCYSIVMEADYLRHSGRSLGKKNGTKFRLVPVSALFRYRYYQACCLDLYVGVGPRYFWVKTKNHNKAVDGHVHTDGIGVVGETGLRYHINDCFDIDLFVAYSYGSAGGPSHKVNIEASSVDVGGLQAGLGIGYKF